MQLLVNVKNLLYMILLHIKLLNKGRYIVFVKNYFSFIVIIISLIYRTDAHGDCVNCVRFIDSRMFATCSDDMTVAL